MKPSKAIIAAAHTAYRAALAAAFKVPAGEMHVSTEERDAVAAAVCAVAGLIVEQARRDEPDLLDLMAGTR